MAYSASGIFDTDNLGPRGREVVDVIEPDRDEEEDREDVDADR